MYMQQEDTKCQSSDLKLASVVSDNKKGFLSILITREELKTDTY